MKRNFALIVLCMAVLTTMGCGGVDTGQQSSTNFDMTILEVEGEFLIQGTVFNDLGSDGVMDFYEPGIEGVEVNLVGLGTETTDADGYYSFSVPSTGSYTVEEVDPAGFLSTTPNSVSVEIVDRNVTVNFGDISEVPQYSIYGTVFSDLNGDGMMGTDEPGIPDVLVELEGVSDVRTGIDGSYSFAVADTGMYTVVETDPEGCVSTTPNEVMIAVADTDVQVDFGDRFIEEIDVDVKPGSDINPLNLRSKGVLPVAILGSEDFDVALIDPTSLLLNGVPPLRWNYSDSSSCHDEEMPDGFGDLILKFSTPEIADSLGDVKQRDIVALTMTGFLMDGTPATGEAVVWIVQVKK